MSSIPTEDLASNQKLGSQAAGVPEETTPYSLGSENSREETLRRMRALPERVAKLMEIIRALREADTR